MKGALSGGRYALVFSSTAPPFFCGDIATPCETRTPCSRGELISSRAMADNNGIAADPKFRCDAKDGCGGRGGAAARCPMRRPRRCGSSAGVPRREPDAQVGEHLKHGRSRAPGQAEHIPSADKKWKRQPAR